jgi:hypothetical protein
MHRFNNLIKMKKARKMLNTVALITSGMLLSSLWISKSEMWKIYLPICLAAIAFSLSFQEDSNGA